MRSGLVLGFLVTVAAGCGAPAPSRALFVGGDVPGVQNALTYRIDPGVGIAGVTPGIDVGYFITANTGGSYRLVWSGDAKASSQSRHFTGSVWTPGQFSQKVDGCNDGTCLLEADDYVSQIHNALGGQRIDWDTFATDGMDGFDVVTDTEPMIFDFFIDGVRHPELVFFPSTDLNGMVASTAGFPFGLVSN